MISLFLVNIFQFEGKFHLRPVTEQLQRAVTAAHWHSTVRLETIYLEFEEEESVLNLFDESGNLLESFPLPVSLSLEIRFFPVLPEADFRMEPAFEPDDNEITQIPFTLNGSPSFVAEIDSGTDMIRLRFDPFSGQILERMSEI